MRKALIQAGVTTIDRFFAAANTAVHFRPHYTHV